MDEFAAATHPDRLQAEDGRTTCWTTSAASSTSAAIGWKNASLADAGSMVCYAALQRLLARAFPAADQQALHNSLLKALPDLVSGVPAVKLWDLSRMIRADAALRELVRSGRDLHDVLGGYRARIRSSPRSAKHSTTSSSTGASAARRN